MTENQQTLIDHLHTYGCTEIRPIVVKIRSKVYHGATYCDPKHSGSLERLYLLGDLPACYKRSTKVAFKREGDTRDWHVACYMTPERLATLDSDKRAFHPAGPNFTLCPWQVPDGTAIDRYAKRPYTRVQMEESAP